MTIADAPPTAPPPPRPLERVVLHGVSWQFYEAALNEIGDQHLLLTYDRGNLEIMAPSTFHEHYKRLVGRFIDVLTMALDIEVFSASATTFRRQDLDRGLEPDECFYIQHAAHFRVVRQIDLSRDPPPDLVVEMEYTRHAIDRLSIYAALGVPEVWRYDGRRLTVMLLQPDRTYSASAASAAFPFLPLPEFERFLARRDSTHETTLVRDFHDWVKANLRKA
jgi:Uma2 family endonuclease